MRREPPVRIREGLGVKLPRATRLVMGFSCEDDARKVMDVLPKRFEKYGLTIHPEKTRLVPFERPDRVPDRTDPERRQPPGSFDLLGFTHYWARSRNGNWVVKRKTSTSRFRRGLQALSRWCQINRHQPLATQLSASARDATSLSGQRLPVGRLRRGAIADRSEWSRVEEALRLGPSSGSESSRCLYTNRDE